MTPDNVELFWNAIKNGYENLIRLGVEYSTLSSELIKELIEMKEKTKY